MEDVDTCSICFDKFTYPKILQCGHTFCFKCLKEYFDEIFSCNRELLCPLCRSKCIISKESGLSLLPTNYFVSISKEDKCCLSCQIADIYVRCDTCGLCLCSRCRRKHVHTRVENIFSKEEHVNGRLGLPLHLFLQNIPTKYICTPENRFIIDIPPNRDGQHVIYCVRLSATGDAYIVPAGVSMIFKCNINGRLLNKIHTQRRCIAVSELNCDTLIGAFTYDKLLQKYESGCWNSFAICTDYFPTDVIEISNGKILACGPSNLSSLSKNLRKKGYLQIYSPKGEPLTRFDNMKSNVQMFDFPHVLAYDNERKLIAVADQDNNSVSILTESGSLHARYQGGSETILPFPAIGVPLSNTFHPWGLCYSPNGFFVVSTPDGCLQFINISGKLQGVALTTCDEGFGRHVAFDKHGVIWCTDSQRGVVKTFKIVQYDNDLSINIRPSTSFQTLFNQFLLS